LYGINESSIMRISKKEQKKSAIVHIDSLFKQAEKCHAENIKLANRYMKMALDIRNKFKITLTREQKMSFCKKCHSFLKPGKSCIVRTKNKMVLYHCKECGNIRRFKI